MKYNKKKYMALLGIIASGTGTINLQFVPESIQIVDSVTGVPVFEQVSQVSVVSGGQQLANLTGARIAGFARMGAFINGASQLLSEWLRLALGRVNGSTTITITHANTNPVNVYGVSSGFSDLINQFVETSINANANQSFTNFEGLILSTPSNIDRVNLTFANGFNDDFSVSELKAMTGSSQNTNASGLLAGGLLIPNFGNVVQATVFVNSTGACVVGVKRLATK